MFKLIAWLTGRSREDFNGKPGTQFKEGLTSVADSFKRGGLNLDTTTEAVSHAIKGASNEKLSAALKHFAETEQINIQSIAMLRSADASARKLEAEADRAEADAKLAQLKVFSDSAGLAEKLGNLGVCLAIGAQGQVFIAKLPDGVRLEKAVIIDQISMTVDRFTENTISSSPIGAGETGNEDPEGETEH